MLQEPSFDRCPFTEGGKTVSAGGAGCPPGAGSVDHGTRFDPLLGAVGARDVDDEGLLGAARVDGEVPALAADADHASSVAYAVTEGVGEGREVLIDPLRAGRVALSWGRPPGGLQQASRRGVGELGPRREQADVAPLGHRGGSRVAGFQDDRVEPALEQVSGGGQSLRTGPDDDDRIHCDLHALTFFDALTGTILSFISTDVNTSGRMEP